MAAVELPKAVQTSTEDPYDTAAVERGRAAVRRLQEMGLSTKTVAAFDRICRLTCRHAAIAASAG